MSPWIAFCIGYVLAAGTVLFALALGHVAAQADESMEGYSARRNGEPAPGVTDIRSRRPTSTARNGQGVS